MTSRPSPPQCPKQTPSRGASRLPSPASYHGARLPDRPAPPPRWGTARVSARPRRPPRAAALARAWRTGKPSVAGPTAPARVGIAVHKPSRRPQNATAGGPHPQQKHGTPCIAGTPARPLYPLPPRPPLPLHTFLDTHRANRHCQVEATRVSDLGLSDALPNLVPPSQRPS